MSKVLNFTSQFAFYFFISQSALSCHHYAPFVLLVMLVIYSVHWNDIYILFYANRRHRIWFRRLTIVSHFHLAEPRFLAAVETVCVTTLFACVSRILFVLHAQIVPWWVNNSGWNGTFRNGWGTSSERTDHQGKNLQVAFAVFLACYCIKEGVDATVEETQKDKVELHVVIGSRDSPLV